MAALNGGFPKQRTCAQGRSLSFEPVATITSALIEQFSQRSQDRSHIPNRRNAIRRRAFWSQALLVGRISCPWSAQFLRHPRSSPDLGEGVFGSPVYPPFHSPPIPHFPARFDEHANASAGTARNSGDPVTSWMEMQKAPVSGLPGMLRERTGTKRLAERAGFEPNLTQALGSID
jgi:hypothetical protein